MSVLKKRRVNGNWNKEWEKKYFFIKGKNDDSQSAIRPYRKKKKENWSVIFLVSTRIMIKNIFWGHSRGLRSLIFHKKA